MRISYCNSAEEIRGMIAKEAMYARAMDKALERDAYWRNSFSDVASRLSGWGHNFVCPECAAHMKMDHDNYNPGGEYVCTNCGRTGVGVDLDEAWVYYYRYDSAHELLASALNYMVNGKQESLDHIIRYVDFYAAHYHEFPVHGQHAGKGKIMSQSLDEAVWALAVLRALWVCGKEAFTEETLSRWLKDLFRPLSELIYSQGRFIHNIPLWLVSAVGVIAIFFGDDELLEMAVESEFGVRNQVKKGYTSDGMWYECSMGYHYYATEAFSEFMGIYRFAHPEDEMFDLLKKAYAAPAELSPDDWGLPALNDGWYPNKVAGSTRQIMYTHRHMPTAATGRQLYLIREREPERFENADTLLFFRDDLDQYSEAMERPDICLFPGTCLAVMNKPSHVILKSGVLTTSHMHPDCMNISIAPFAEDIGTPGYGHPMTRTYYDRTLCHNTFLMDGASQPNRPVVGSVKEVANGVQAHADNIYDGVSCTRTLTEKDGKLYDEMHITADQAHQFDWVFRSAGTAQLPAGGAEATFPGAEVSYDRLTNIRKYEGAETFTVQWELDGRKLTASICPETLKNVDVYTAVMPGNPADHPLTAILLRTTSADVIIRASYEFA